MITGGGGTVYEGVYFDCKTFSIARNLHQKKNIQKFQRSKFCIEIKKMKKNYLINFFKKNLINHKKSNQRLVDNKGILRINKLIFR